MYSSLQSDISFHVLFFSFFRFWYFTFEKHTLSTTCTCSTTKFFFHTRTTIISVVRAGSIEMKSTIFSQYILCIYTVVLYYGGRRVVNVTF